MSKDKREYPKDEETLFSDLPKLPEIPKIKPDKFPPSLHRMGKYTWNMQDRKLDALFAIYVMRWETKDSGTSKWRYWIRRQHWNKDGWESDMLPYFHDDIRACYKGVEKARKENKIYLVISSNKDGYEVIAEDHSKTKVNSTKVLDEDLNFAIMSSLLLMKGLTHKEIQNAWNNQKDWIARS